MDSTSETNAVATTAPVVESSLLKNLTKEQLTALESMRTTFQNADGHGMPMNDSTFLRYLRAR